MYEWMNKLSDAEGWTPMQSQVYILRICLEIGRGFSRLREVERGWVGLSQLITGGAQLNGLVGWQGPQPQQPSSGLCWWRHNFLILTDAHVHARCVSAFRNLGGQVPRDKFCSYMPSSSSWRAAHCISWGCAACQSNGDDAVYILV